MRWGISMDIATGAGLLAGLAVITTLILLGGDFRIFYDLHAIIIIGGGSLAATMIRFPFVAIIHGLPLGLKFAFTMRSTTSRELVDELARLAEVARKQGPVGLEKVDTDDAFLAKESATSPTAMTWISSATISSVTATTS